jgi:hypothetical protein
MDHIMAAFVAGSFVTKREKNIARFSASFFCPMTRACDTANVTAELSTTREKVGGDMVKVCFVFRFVVSTSPICTVSHSAKKQHSRRKTILLCVLLAPQDGIAQTRMDVDNRLAL